MIIGTISATMGDAKGAEKYFQDLIYKARKNKSDNLAHFLVNNGLVNIQLVRVIIIRLFVKSSSVLNGIKYDNS